MNEHLTPDLIVDYLHGELAPEDDALAHAHIAACAACRHDADADRQLVDVLRGAFAATDVEMPSMVKAAVWQQIRDAKPSPVARLAAWLQPALAVPAFAVLLVAGWFVSPYGHAGSAPTIDATYYLQAHASQSAQTPLSDQVASPSLETSMLSTTQPPLVAEAETSAALAAGDPR